LGGLFYTAGVLLRGPFADPQSLAPHAFAARAGTATFPVSYLLIVLASGLAMFGFVGMRDRLQHRLAPLAMVLSIVGLHFLTAFFGVMAIAYPAIAAAYTGGDRDAVTIAARALSSPVTMTIMAVVSLNVLGHVLFAVAMWRSAGLSRTAAVLFVLAPIGQLLPFIYPVEILGCALLAISGFWIAGALSRDSASRASEKALSGSSPVLTAAQR
jgi:hypothetical protein